MTVPAEVKSKAPVDDDSVGSFIARIGNRVRLARQQKAMSRRMLSDLSGVSQRYLAQLETGTGNISVALLYRVAAALGLTPDRLLGGADPWDTDLHQFVALFKQADADQRSSALEALSSGTGPADKGRRICLIGLRGAGKSTLGQMLAEHLSIEFLELNRIIEDLSGMPVAEIIALYGQEGYRRLERRALDSACEAHDEIVLAVGGGIVSESETYSRLLQTFHTVWIKASPEEHMERVRQQGDSRPMAGNPKAMEELRSILTARESLYARAEAMVDTTGSSIDEAHKNLVEAVHWIVAPNN